MIVHHGIVPVVGRLDELVRLVLQPVRHREVLVSLLTERRLGPVAVAGGRHVRATAGHGIVFVVVVVVVVFVVTIVVAIVGDVRHIGTAEARNAVDLGPSGVRGSVA